MSKNQINKKIDLQHLKLKAANFCAYQERSVLEVKQKLQKLGANQAQTTQVIDDLVNEGFIDESRFARVYANGKLAQNKWGKHKIAHALQQKGINKTLVDEALAGLDEKKYLHTLSKLIEKKNREVKETDLWIRKNKIAQSVSLKGFEADLIFQEIDEMLKSER